MRQRRPLLTALAALAAILFAQTAMAFASWDFGNAPCHEPAAPGANVCATHCANNDLTLDTPKVKVPVAAAAPAPIAFPATAPYPQHAPVRISVLPAGPPPRILYHSFLI